MPNNQRIKSNYRDEGSRVQKGFGSQIRTRSKRPLSNDDVTGIFLDFFRETKRIYLTIQFLGLLRFLLGYMESGKEKYHLNLRCRNF